MSTAKAIGPQEDSPTLVAPLPIVCVSTLNGLAGNAVALCLQEIGYRCILAKGKGETLDMTAWLPPHTIVLVDLSGHGTEQGAVIEALGALRQNGGIEVVFSAHATLARNLQSHVFARSDLFSIPLDRPRLIAAVDDAAARLLGLATPSANLRDLDSLHLPLDETGIRGPADWHLDAAQRKRYWRPLLRSLIRFRERRADLFQGELFTDPCWDMLLDLMLHTLEGREVSVSSLCIASRVPPTTALRRMEDLAKAGWVRRVKDPNDGRRVLIALTEAASDRLGLYLDGIILTRLPRWQV